MARCMTIISFPVPERPTGITCGRPAYQNGAYCFSCSSIRRSRAEVEEMIDINAHNTSKKKCYFNIESRDEIDYR